MEIQVFVVLVTLAFSLGASEAIRQEPSAASDGQIRFAVESKYDDTGPGAKQPEYAYHTYKNLEEALVSYINDKDTKLPEREKAIAFRNLMLERQNEQYQLSNSQYIKTYNQPQRFEVKTVEEYTKGNTRQNAQPVYITRYSLPEQKTFYHEPSTKTGIFDLRGAPALKNFGFEDSHKPYKVTKISNVKESPLSISYFKREPEFVEVQDDFNPNPQYTFSYGVHDRKTGDFKAAHETRDGDTVRGYYTVIDADGKQRTVHYTADDKEGFKAVVQRTNTNAQ